LRNLGEVSRTVVVKSTPLPRKLFRVFVKLEGMYRNMVEQLVLYAMKSGVTSFTKLKASKYRELKVSVPTATVALRVHSMSRCVHEG
jgi:putative transposase